MKQKSLKVLVVDDEPSILELLKTALSSFGNCTVTAANSAAGALKILEKTEVPFECFLLDIQMPTMNGIELLRRIRSLPQYSETPVIMLTAMSERKYVEEAFLEGATDYVTKPFDFLELRSRINSAHLLMQERLKAQKTMESARFLREELDYNQQFNLEDPLSIEGLDRFLRYVEFDNYIEQLSRGRLFDSWVTAIKLQDAEFYFDLSNCGDFRRAIADIGAAIQKTTKDSDAVFSYRGNGVFLVVTHGKEATIALPLEERLNQVFQTILGNRRASGWLRALIGERVSMRSLSKAGAFSAMNKATKNVDMREAALRKDVEAHPEEDGLVEPASQEKERRRIYERVMLELFGKDCYLAQK
ncbi:Response regulator receiver domain-containing protein [Ruegeria marina]|uniref:Response regulator receiver domain-containing protein n=1 Tax=Ruegeria marina TaxID=639004 RepID=A0A1G7E2F3_9RHOB|nr:Response regulator receiver domain-containing protein [Ruegeria marina]